MPLLLYLILRTPKLFPGLSTVVSHTFPDGPIVSLRSSGVISILNSSIPLLNQDGIAG